MDVKTLMTGNEGVARGAFEAGVHVASAYPGTPSTEILEELAKYPEVYCEWAPNEKVAVETAVGASIAGARSLSAMKHVGMNVAADPMFTYAYLGVNGGCVLVSADDPGLHSSQNEQDNRYYALHAKIPLVEPSDSQEAKDFTREAYRISERFDVPVLFRMTTRLCHSKTPVELGEREEIPLRPYARNIPKFVATPAACRRHHVELEHKLQELETFASDGANGLNVIVDNNSKLGVISAGVAFSYAHEVFGSEASYLKLGMSYPFPRELVKKFAGMVDELIVIEENDPYLETQVKALGIACTGKDKIPLCGELNPHIIAAALGHIDPLKEEVDEEFVVARPPTLCSGCPHRGLFFELAKIKKAVITGDIGCYTLGSADPLNAMDSVICMGAGISAAHGFAKAFEKSGDTRPIFGVVGDSTFFHSGITSLLNIVYNHSNVTSIILDNRITGMTGHQENPGTGYTLQGKQAKQTDIPTLVRALGVKDVHEVNPNRLDEVRKALKEAMAFEGPSVIVTRWPCALKRLREEEKREFGDTWTVFEVDPDVCRKCKMCLKAGCPSITFSAQTGSFIDPDTCVGCGVCAQICPFGAISERRESNG